MDQRQECALSFARFLRNANKGAETDMLLVLEHLINSMINIAEFYIDFSNKTLERIKAQIEAENAGR